MAASIVASHVASGGAPANSGFELAFLMSAAIAVAAAGAGLLIPVARRAAAGSSDPVLAEG